MKCKKYANESIALAVVANTGKTKQSNKIEREIKMKSQPENSTFGFCRHAKKANPKKPKELFFANACANIETEL